MRRTLAIRGSLFAMLVAYLPWQSHAVADVQLWLQSRPNNVVEVWARSDEAPRAISQVAIALRLTTEPEETSYPEPPTMAFKRSFPAPPGMIVRWFIPPMTGRWADKPPVWKKLRTDAQIFALPVTEADVGRLVLNYDRCRVFRLEEVVDGVGKWVDAGPKEIIWKAPYLSESPILLLTLRFASDPGEMTFVFDAVAGYPMARTVLYLRPHHGRWANAVPIEVIEPPEAPADMPMRILRGVRHLLLHEPSQVVEAVALIDETIGDDE
jgi:hypothetical protein